MPKYKHSAWSKEQRNKIRIKRFERGYDSAEDFAKALKERGLDQTGYSYLCRERGEQEVSIDEIQVYADVLGISVLEAIELFSHRRNAVQHDQTANCSSLQA